MWELVQTGVSNCVCLLFVNWFVIDRRDRASIVEWVAYGDERCFVYVPVSSRAISLCCAVAVCFCDRTLLNIAYKQLLSSLLLV